VAREIDQQVIWTCASPDYLRRYGKPDSPEELSAYACLLFRLPSTGQNRPWQFRAGKRDFSLMPEGNMRLGDGEALVEMATAGIGLIQVPSYIAEDHVKRGELVEVLQKYRPAPMPISIVYPSHRHIPLRVRALVDALVERRLGAR
jgi:DNA-binding transcriptional LysR family regulator